MAISSSKCSGVEDFKTMYTTKEKVNSFSKSIKLAGTGNEKDVILKSFSKEKQFNMIAFACLLVKFFYMHLHVVHDSGALIPLQFLIWGPYDHKFSPFSDNAQHMGCYKGI